MRLLRKFSWVLLFPVACSSNSDPDSIRGRAQSKVNERVQFRQAVEESSEVQPEESLPVAELKVKLQECLDAMIAQEAQELRLCFTREAAAIHADSETVYKGGSEIVASMYQPAWSAFPNLRGGAELILMKGTDVALLAWGKGTHTGELSGLDPTENQIGVNSLKVLMLANDGRIRMEASYSDSLRVLGQLDRTRLPYRPVFEKVPEDVGWIVASNNELEAANQKAAEAVTLAMGAHDSKRYGASFARQAVLVDYALKSDLQGAHRIESEFKELIGAFSNLKLETRARWSAGEYVVQLLTLSAKHDGAWPTFELEPTKRKLTVNLGMVLRFKKGKISKLWRFWDAKPALTRLGITFEK